MSQHDAPARPEISDAQFTLVVCLVTSIIVESFPQVISGEETATTFAGNLTGNVTGTASANAVLTGSTNNQLVTVTPGANAITGESGFNLGRICTLASRAPVANPADSTYYVCSQCSQMPL